METINTSCTEDNLMRLSVFKSMLLSDSKVELHLPEISHELRILSSDEEYNYVPIMVEEEMIPLVVNALYFYLKSKYVSSVVRECTMFLLNIALSNADVVASAKGAIPMLVNLMKHVDSRIREASASCVRKIVEASYWNNQIKKETEKNKKFTIESLSRAFVNGTNDNVKSLVRMGGLLPLISVLEFKNCNMDDNLLLIVLDAIKRIFEVDTHEGWLSDAKNRCQGYLLEFQNHQSTDVCCRALFILFAFFSIFCEGNQDEYIGRITLIKQMLCSESLVEDQLIKVTRELRTLSSAKDYKYVPVMVEEEMIPLVVKALNSFYKSESASSVVRDCTTFLANVALSNADVVANAKGAIPTVVYLMEHGDLYIRAASASCVQSIAEVLSKRFLNGTNDDVKYFVSVGWLLPLISVLKIKICEMKIDLDDSLLLVVLDAIKRIFQVGENHINLFKDEEGIDCLKKLQKHPSNDVRVRICSLFPSHLRAEGNENMEPAVGQSVQFMPLPDREVLRQFNNIASDVMCEINSTVDLHTQDVVSFFGATSIVIAKVWELIFENNRDIQEQQSKKEHLLWALHYMKHAPNLTNLCETIKTNRYGKQAPCKRTVLKWIWFFVKEIRALEDTVIVWENRKTNDRRDDCLVSVDCTDCPIQEIRFDHPTKPGRKITNKALYSQKFNGPALRYEVAISLFSNDIVWINGPFCPGDWSDLEIFRKALKYKLEGGERVEADDGYVGESPEHVVCPALCTTREDREAMMRRAEERRETLNKHKKNWKCLQSALDVKGTPVEKMSKHESLFRACAVMRQVAMQMEWVLNEV